MATIRVTPAEGAEYSAGELVQFIDLILTEAAIEGETTPTEFNLVGTFPDGIVQAKIGGVGFVYENIFGDLIPVAGTVQQVVAAVDGVVHGLIEIEPGVEISELAALVQAEESGGSPFALEDFFQGFDWEYIGTDLDEIAPMDATIGDGAPFNLRGNDVFALMGGNDILFAGDGDDRVSGGDGADALIGGNGNDILSGDANPGDQGDFHFGGAGDDTYHVDSSLDFVDEGIAFSQYGFGGTDTIISTADFFWDVHSAAEILIVDEAAVDAGGDGTTIVHSVFSGMLVGNSGTNVMFGRGGADIYRAGDGVDFMSLSTLGLTDENAYAGVDGANTVLVEKRASGAFSYDIVFEFESGKDKIDVSSYDYSSAEEVFARGVDDGLGSSYFALGDGLDYVYMVGLELSELSAADFIV